MKNSIKYHFPNLPSISKKTRNAYAILVFGFMITVIATFQIHLSAEKKAKTEFETICDEINVKIDTRLHAHALILRSGSAFFAASDTVTQSEWKRYIESSEIEKNLPGILGVGFSVIIPKDELYQHIQNKQKEGFPDYTIYPAGDREIYTSIIYLEPFSGRNLRAFGYDMFSEPVRRKAMELSRDNNLAVLSGKVLLVQESSEDVQTGVLMYVPVYKKGMTINTIEQRRAAILGWVYSPYRMNDLMTGILGKRSGIGLNRIHLQIFNDIISDSSLLYQSCNDNLHTNYAPSRTFSIPVEFNGKKWVLLFSQFNSELFSFNWMLIILFFGGIFISFLLYHLYLSLINKEIRAFQIAEQLTAELNESKEKYYNDFNLLHSIFESPNEIVIFSIDLNYCYSEFTKSHEKIMKMIWGIDIKIGMNMLDIISDEKDREKAKINFDRALQGDYFILTEEYGDTSLLRTFYENHYSSIKNPEGLIVGASVFVIDVTARKRLEMELRNSTMRLENIIEATNVGTWEWNFQTGETIFNERWAEMLGYTLGELDPVTINTWKKLAHPDDLKKSDELLNFHFEGKQPYYIFECRMKHKEGHWVWIQDKGQLIIRTEDGKPLMIFGTHNDITERKQAEQELIIAKEKAEENEAKLKQSNVAKDKFFSIIGHDLRSPFNSIIGFSDILIEQINEKDYSNINLYAEAIQRSSNSAMDLLMNLMEWSQSQTGRMEFNPEFVELVGLIEETELLLAGSLHQKTISLTKNMPSNAPVFADKKMINTIMRNLISNAIKYTHPDGNICIAIEEKQEELLVSISDNGVGISKVDREKLFKIDQTYSTSGTKNEKGTGMGLILCKEFVEKHDGKIWVESEVGKGSAIYFTIPKNI